MTTTLEAPTAHRCGTEAIVQDGTQRVVACDLEQGHAGWHEGELKDEQGETQSLVTWR
jgi:hypothetical protein